MKKNIHPKYQKVLFVDSSTGHKFVCGSTLQTNETATFEGAEYPMYRLSTSSSSHPFFTGSKGLVDAEGRVDKFKKKYIAAQQKKEDSNEEGQDSKKQGKEDSKKQSKKK